MSDSIQRNKFLRFVRFLSIWISEWIMAIPDLIVSTRITKISRDTESDKSVLFKADLVIISPRYVAGFPPYEDFLYVLVDHYPGGEIPDTGTVLQLKEIEYMSRFIINPFAIEYGGKQRYCTRAIVRGILGDWLTENIRQLHSIQYIRVMNPVAIYKIPR